MTVKPAVLSKSEATGSSAPFVPSGGARVQPGEFGYVEEEWFASGQVDGHPFTTSLLVSHRFSTVRMADQIAVLDGGRIREHGTHDQLIAANGLYAELYAIQASAYA